MCRLLYWVLSAVTWQQVAPMCTQIPSSREAVEKLDVLADLITCCVPHSPCCWHVFKSAQLYYMYMGLCYTVTVLRCSSVTSCNMVAAWLLVSVYRMVPLLLILHFTTAWCEIDSVNTCQQIAQKSVCTESDMLIITVMNSALCVGLICMSLCTLLLWCVVLITVKSPWYQQSATTVRKVSC